MTSHLLSRYLLVILSLYSLALAAEPVVSVTSHYYQIQGDTAKALRREMNTKSPVKQNGKRYDAYTAWSVKWRYTWDRTEHRCEINRVTTTVDVTFTLPDWQNYEAAPSALQQHWDDYYQALVAHEQGHQAFGVEAATEIEQGILALGPRENCQRLERDANKLGYKTIAAHSASEKQYDLDTNHGMNDGAVFP